MHRGKKHIVIKIPEGVDKEKYIEYIMDAIQSQFARYRIRGNRLDIQLTGDPVSIQRSIDQIKKAQEDFMIEENIIGRRKGVVLIPKSMIGKTLRKPISMEALKTYLQLKNIDYEETEEELIVYYNLDELIEETNDLYNQIIAAKELFKGKAAEIAAIIAVTMGVSLNEIGSVGRNAGVFKKEEEKLVLAREKTQALAMLIDLFG